MRRFLFIYLLAVYSFECFDVLYLVCFSLLQLIFKGLEASISALTLSLFLEISLLCLPSGGCDISSGYMPCDGHQLLMQCEGQSLHLNQLWHLQDKKYCYLRRRLLLLELCIMHFTQISGDICSWTGKKTSCSSLDFLLLNMPEYLRLGHMLI